jgi:hypothetical protein
MHGHFTRQGVANWIFLYQFSRDQEQTKLLPSPNEGSEDYCVVVVASAEMSLSMDVGIIIV